MPLQLSAQVNSPAREE